MQTKRMNTQHYGCLALGFSFHFSLLISLPRHTDPKTLPAVVLVWLSSRVFLVDRIWRLYSDAGYLRISWYILLGICMDCEPTSVGNLLPFLELLKRSLNVGGPQLAYVPDHRNKLLLGCPLLEHLFSQQREELVMKSMGWIKFPICNTKIPPHPV